MHRLLRKDAGVDDRGGLENRCTAIRTQGSNPCLSAIGCDFGRNFFCLYELLTTFVGRPRIWTCICFRLQDTSWERETTHAVIATTKRQHFPTLMPDIPVCRLCFRRFINISKIRVLPKNIVILHLPLDSTMIDMYPKTANRVHVS